MALAIKPYIEVAVTTSDTSNEKGHTTYYYKPLSDYATTNMADIIELMQERQTDIQALESGVINHVTATIIGVDTGDAPGGAYQPIDFRCPVTWRTADGETKIVSFHTPLIALFPTDGETLNTADPTVITWADNTQLFSPTTHHNFQGVDEDGSNLTVVVSGKLQWNQRKNSNKPA